MGSYYETDGVTQLPIEYGDPVRVFVLLRRQHDDYGNGVSYGNELWIPIGAPVKGTYYDYGRIDNIEESISTKLLFNHIQAGWSSNSGRETFIKESLTISEMMQDICAGSARFKSNLHSKYYTDVLGGMFVLEDIYQAMIKSNHIVAGHKLFTTESRSEYEYMPKLKAVELEIKNWYEYHGDSFANKDEHSKLFATLDASHDLGLITNHESGLRIIFDPLLDLMGELAPYEDPRVQELCGIAKECLIFQDAMMNARKLWITQSGKGSQGNDSKIYQDINKAAEKIILSRHEKFEGLLSDDIVEGRDEEGYSPYMREHNASLRKNNASEKE